MFPTLKDLFIKVCEDFDAELVEFNGEDDHVPLLVNYPPKVALSKLVNSLKGVSSRKLKHFHPEVANRYYKSALWSPSYFAATSLTQGGRCTNCSHQTVRATAENTTLVGYRRRAYIPALEVRGFTRF